MATRRLVLGFRSRLLIAMLTIVVITVASIAGLLLLNLFEAEKTRARQQLNVAGGVALEVLARRNELLAARLQVAVEDFGFRSAIASGDQPTITSALVNQIRRAGADVALLSDNQGRLVANLHGLENGTVTPFPELLEAARGQRQAADIRSWNGKAYQLIVVPVQGAGLRAWLTAGFLLDDSFAKAISDLTGTEVVVKRQQDDLISILASSFEGGQFDAGFLDTFGTGEGERMVETQQYFSRVLPISDGPEDAIQLLLLSSRSNALQSYFQLAWEIGLLVLVVLVVAGILVLATARAFGRPVLELANFASAIGSGRRAEPPRIRTTGELRVLRDALSHMILRIREREHRLEHNALHDELTGLNNRKAVDNALGAALSDNRPCWVLALSLAKFKAINDTLGFSFGDQVIIATGLRLRGKLDPRHPIGRTGGNEFTALVPDQGPEALEELILQLKEQVEDATVIQDTPINLKVHIAALRIPDQAQTPDQVRRRINLTLERAREAENQAAIYQPGGDEHHLRELRLIQDLQPAMLADEMYMNYQPKVCFESAEFHQVEALIRWKHGELGFIGPDEFILLAERSGQVHLLTEFILHRIARDARQWHQEGLDIGVAINLSALDLTNRALPSMILNAFESWECPRDRITFEVTESAVMSDPALAVQTLEKLRALGFRLSVDDFGTGYSSLAQLRSLPVHELKIDKSFVLKLDTEPQDQLIVQSTIDMAHRLGLSVVAEGIENEASWRLLQHWGCNLAQGFFLARPLPAAGLLEWQRAFRQRTSELQHHQHHATGEAES
ncbi:MAG: EAL domain-containing protein [Marinobacter sp.]|uniref:putative bifunctional diguanylate cyclase/phosphodiesterase n=1 Tax=Marinobacter sp. TaxID=50741 RepID=UPI00299E19A7|nr:EAL domain-containing protein [Marinobacter sp.]MDX1634144.1 EAL domain-containing protein [Marinobacter sp.]